MARSVGGDRGDSWWGQLRSDVADAAHPAVVALVGICSLAAVAGWFLVRSPMWLDEALSVNISKLPISQIPGALRHDGHPPLFYVLLHGWMAIFGTGTHAVRAMSGLFALITIPLAWAAGKRLGGRRLALSVALVFVLSPFALRYASETRMYSLLIAEVFAGYLVASASLERPTPIRLLGVTLVTGALLWTQYWSMWLLGSVGVLLIVRLALLQRAATRDDAPVEVAQAFRGTLATMAAIIVGGLTFVPWLPTLLYQSAHTGTPWAPAFRPTTMVFTSLVEFGGGPYSEPELFMLVLVFLVVLGIAGRPVGDRAIEIDLSGRTAARRPLLVLIGTLVIASIAGLATGMGFAPRYAAVFFPLFALLVALGVEAIPRGRARDVSLAVFAVASIVCVAVVFRLDRSQSRVVAERIRATAPAGLVIACPDQLGPSLARELAGPGYDIRAYPRLGDPRFVDWVDYAQRNKRNDPAAVADRVLQVAGNRPIFVVYRDDFLTLQGQCGALVQHLAAGRPTRLIVTADKDFYEPMNAIELAPPAR